MNKQQAVNLLNETFSNEFGIDRFLSFVKELLKKVDLRAEDRSKYVPNEFKSYIEEVTKLGEYNTNKKVIEILVIKLSKESSKQRARVMQRNFIAKWLSDFEHDAALVAFHDETDDWRFSFVKMEYQLVEEEGKVKAKAELTPARRYSYLVGKNEPNHTCRKQFLDLLLEDEQEPNIEEIETAFSVEKVTKEFFERYKDLFLQLKESLDEIVKKDKNVAKEFTSKNIDTVEFSKKLLGQIVFLYFLQKKGWLGVQKDEAGRLKPWGTGPKNFMRKLFGSSAEKPLVPYKNFFNDILEPLFYEALAEPRTEDFYARFNCKIPFLNGGLFEPPNDYDWINTNVFIDNEIFDDILSTFDEFNFTVKEDEPLEREVAVDPEMLGKVFENLLEIKDRKSKGAFYTPREIVHYMCQQSLINYLETNTKIPRQDIEKFIRSGETVLDQTLRAQEHKKKYNGQTFDIDYEKVLPETIQVNCQLIDNLLKDIKIVDPAVGSGAFPIGMMSEIVKVRSVLSIFFDEERKIYDLKRETIENCLYGVDIMPSAVEICKLRFWLSLIVDEADMKNIKPLPNLDHKIMCGNSLLEEFEGVKLFDDRLLGEFKKDYSFEIKQIDEKIALLYNDKGDIVRGKKNGSSVKDIEKEIKKLERKKEDIKSKTKENERNLTLGEISEKKIKESRKKLAELKKLQKEYFDAQNSKVKKQLREDIDRIEWELIEETLKEQGNAEAMQKLKQYKKNKAKPFFLWKLYFAEVFQRENPGFDVVIANPPYVRIQTIENELKEIYSKNYSTAKGKYDLYILFTELGLKIIRGGGVLSYIMPNKFTNAQYGEELREIISKNTIITDYIDFSDKGVFETATNYPCVIILKKSNPVNNQIDYFKVKRISSTLVNSFSISKGSRKYENDDLSFFKIPQEIFGRNSWIFAGNDLSNLLIKLSNQERYSPFKVFSDKIYEGLITGNNKIFFINKEIIKKYNLELKLIRKLPKGKKINRYKIGWQDYYVIYPYEEENGKTVLLDLNNFPNTKKYLEEYKAELMKRRYLIDAGKKWYEIWNPRAIAVFAQTKIITPNLSSINKFALDNFSNSKDYMCIDHDCYGIILKEKKMDNYLLFLGILNSSLTNMYVKNISPMFSGGYYKYHTQYIEKIPIPNKFDPEIRERVILIVDQILSITKDDDYLKNPDKQAKVKKLEKEIDQLVYKLYDLSSDEIKIVEQSSQKDKSDDE